MKQHKKLLALLAFTICLAFGAAALYTPNVPLNNRLDSLSLPEDYYDYIVVDEVHHVAASSYRKIINHFRPKVLL